MLNEIKLIPVFLITLFALYSIQLCQANEDLITTAQNKSGDVIPYVLNYKTMSPKYVIILFPGGNGIVNPHMEGDKLVYKARTNFLLRARKFIVDEEFSTISTDASQSKERIQAIIDDIKSRFTVAQIYLMGTSKGTFDTMDLAEYLSDKISGEIHTSSMKSISTFDAHKYKNRHLVVHHKQDSCFATPFTAAEASHSKYGNEFIIMEGGITEGDPCEAFAYHGYNGIEKETAEAIKKWIKQDPVIPTP